MGTTIKAACPRCGEQEMPVHEVTLRLSSRDAAANHYAFRCPGCSVVVEKHADAFVIRALTESSEVRREHFEPAWMLESRPTQSLRPLTEDDVLDMIIALYAAPSTLVERIGAHR